MKKILFLLLILFCFPSCLNAKQSDFFDKTLILPIATEPKTFNIMVAQETSSTEVTQYLFEGLTEWDPRTGKIVPKLAERWEISDDNRVWTFYLRKNVQWSDGVPLTARDVLFTFEKIIFNPEIPTSARDIFIIQGKPIALKVLNDQTIQFELPVPFAPFLFALSQPIVPQHILENVVQNGTFPSAWGLGEDPRRIVGTGPFRIAKVLPGERIELTRNENYWKSDAQGRKLPLLERILLLIIPNPESQLLRFLEGETDYCPMRGQDYPLLKPLEAKKGFKVYDAGPSLGSYFVAFNQQTKNPWKKKLFQNRDFRRALAHGIDRKSMMDLVFNRLAVKQCSPISPSVPLFYDPNVTCYDYEPETAKRILTDIVGCRDKNQDGILEDEEGHPLEVVLATNSEDRTRTELAQMIREDWRRIGIKVHLLPLEFNTLVAKLTVTQDWEAVLMGLTGTVDPHFGANVWLSSGNLHFWNPGASNATYIETKIDQLFNKAVVSLDPEERKKDYDEWQYLVSEELPLIYTVLPEVLYAVRDRFVSLKPTALGGPFYPMEELETKKS